jgi:patatin-like phospholipase/acyl hydrolase
VSETAAPDHDPGTYSCARDYHLFGPGPKRILALDGGGVRGAISVAFLERIEEIFAQHRRDRIAQRHQELAAAGASHQDHAKIEAAPDANPIRLADQFDMIGGTSTGAIIAGALALGYGTERIRAFYLDKAKTIFPSRRRRLQFVQSKFDARPLRKEIEEVVEQRTLESHDIVTGLCMIAKRMDTGSPWILSNDPLAPYWNADPVNPDAYLPNKDYKLSNLVRASTAAPHFFDPEFIPISKKAQEQVTEAEKALVASPLLSQLVARAQAIYLLSRKAIIARLKTGDQSEKPSVDTHGLFIDGGVTPYNNPSLALLMLAALKRYQLCWPLGPEQLTLVSIGTGWHRTRLSLEQLGFLPHPRLAMSAMLSLMRDAEILALALMQWFGQCDDPWEINSEIGNLKDDLPGGKPDWFRFMRYDLRLEKAWLKKHLGLNLSDRDLKRFQRMDYAPNIGILYELAQVAAQMQVKETHFFPKGNANGATASAAGA